MELIPEVMDPFRHFGSSLWAGSWATARPLPTQDSTTHKIPDIHPCLKRDSNPWFQCSSGPRPSAP